VSIESALDKLSILSLDPETDGAGRLKAVVRQGATGWRPRSARVSNTRGSAPAVRRHEPGAE
jgi:hypothetical protein